MMKDRNKNSMEVMVGMRFPLDMSFLPTDICRMELLGNPSFIISMGDITPDELANFEAHQPMEFRYLAGTGENKIYGIILCKFGNLVQEFVFNPVPCKKKLLEYMGNDNNAFFTFVLEGTTREIRAMNLRGFTKETRTFLFKKWNAMIDADIKHSDYMNWYEEMWEYSTEQMWNMAEYIGKLEPKTIINDLGKRGHHIWRKR